MKTKLISLTWRGFASVDPRFSAAMLSWSIADIYTRDSFERVWTMIIHKNIVMRSCNTNISLIKHLITPQVPNKIDRK